MNYPFRSAPFGGFNRQDVLDYLEDSARESTEKQTALTRQLEETRSTLSALSSELSQLRSRLGQLTQDNQNLSARLAKTEQDSRVRLEGLRAQLKESEALCSRQGKELDALGKENQELKDKVAWMEPEATAYSIVKVRTAGIEMEAHRRAQLIENQSKQEAEDLRTQVNEEVEALRQKTAQEVEHIRMRAVTDAENLRTRTQAEVDAMKRAAEEEDRTVRQQLADWLAETTDHYNCLCAQMKSAMEQVDGQLSRAKDELTSAASLLEHQRQALTALPRPAPEPDTGSLPEKEPEQPKS